ncbi:hypothetical protein KC726_01995 [Candidatus Woesebacteria bacterium]|nr:hypothetical protein [Candidatus Woesebacteria bacterium]
MDTQLVDICYQKAIAGLLKNKLNIGLAAAEPKEKLEKDYDTLFTRDTAICTLGMVASGNEELIALTKQSLDALSNAQSKKGQFPSNTIPEKGWTQWWMPGTIDGTLWWPIAVLNYVKQTGDREYYTKHKERIEKAFTWLTYQDTNNDNLLEQGEAAGWDDEMPRMGLVLLTNALWYWLVSLRIEVEERHDLTKLKGTIYEGINTMLWVHKSRDNNMDYIPDNEYTRNNTFAKTYIEWVNARVVYLPHYLGFLSHKTYEMRCETLGNVLACITGLADHEKAKLITDHIVRAGINKPYPIKVLHPPIYPGEEDWREYMQKGRQNYPWQYHNGGIWLFAGGFWVMWLAQQDKERAEQELEKLAQANALNDWAFNEFLHGQHGTPMGIDKQSWSMAMYIAAYKAVKK